MALLLGNNYINIGYAHVYCEIYFGAFFACMWCALAIEAGNKRGRVYRCVTSLIKCISFLRSN